MTCRGGFERGALFREAVAAISAFMSISNSSGRHRNLQQEAQDTIKMKKALGLVLERKKIETTKMIIQIEEEDEARLEGKKIKGGV
ncbi:hypothetical protein ACSBR2_037667 [Camellia fascicularis]